MMRIRISVSIRHDCVLCNYNRNIEKDATFSMNMSCGHNQVLSFSSIVINRRTQETASSYHVFFSIDRVFRTVNRKEKKKMQRHVVCSPSAELFASSEEKNEKMQRHVVQRFIRQKDRCFFALYIRA